MPASFQMAGILALLNRNSSAYFRFSYDATVAAGG